MTCVLKDAWLFLLREGGCWTAAGVAEETGLPLRKVQMALGGLTRTGAAHNRGKSPRQRRVLYEVTPACAIPATVTVAEVSRAAALPAAQNRKD